MFISTTFGPDAGPVSLCQQWFFTVVLCLRLQKDLILCVNLSQFFKKKWKVKEKDLVKEEERGVSPI